jgi:hypothetical protein
LTFSENQFILKYNLKETEMKIEQVFKTGDHWTVDINTTYDKIVEVLGFKPNVTHIDDSDKVKASWGFTVDGIRCGIWCYKYPGNPVNCNHWSFFGPKEIAIELFGEEN